MDTLYLDPQKWDLTTDASGNIAMASNPYAVAQDVASAGRLWLGEALFDIERGIPYRKSVLGYLPSSAMLDDWYRTEAMTVPEVRNAVPSFTYENRQLGGQILVTLEDGTTVNVAISN